MSNRLKMFMLSHYYHNSVNPFPPLWIALMREEAKYYIVSSSEGIDWD